MFSQITLDNFFSVSKNLTEDYTEEEMPGYLEIEPTNECNLSCDNCPQTKLTRDKTFITLDKFKEIIDYTTQRVPFLSLSGFGEPTLHPNLIEMISYAKKKNFLKVCLETNGSKLTDDFIREIIAAGLDVLLLNLDALDLYSKEAKDRIGGVGLPSEEVIDRILKVRESQGSKLPYIVLQVIKNSSNDDRIEYYHHRWEYLADVILIQPYNDFLKTFPEDLGISFAPFKEGVQFCQKSMSSLQVFADSSIPFCKQKFNEKRKEKDIKECFLKWRNNRLQGLKQNFCNDCQQWYLIDFGPFPVNKGGVGKVEDYLYNDLIPLTIEKGESYYQKGDYEKALDLWEKVLKFQPTNEFIHNRLNKMLKS